MTVKEMIDILQFLPHDAEVIFEPENCCSAGYPNWSDAVAIKSNIRNEVLVRLKGESDD
jgi:hypothetical protein